MRSISKTISCETAAQKDKRDGKGTKKYVSSDGGDLFQKHFYTKGKIPPGSHPAWVLFHLLYGLLNDTPAYQIILADGQFYLTEAANGVLVSDFLFIGVQKKRKNCISICREDFSES